MKRLIKTITANTDVAFEDKRVFSLTDIVDLLNQIEELYGYDIGLETDTDNSCLLAIGNNQYEITNSK